MDALKQEIIKQYVAGVPVKQIELRFCQGYGIGILYRWLKESNIPLRGRGRDPIKKRKWHKLRKEAIKQYMAGVPVKQIASLLSVSLVTLYKWIRISNIPLREPRRSNQMKLRHKSAMKWFLAGRNVKDITAFFKITEHALYKLFDKCQIVDCIQTDEEN